MKKLLLAAALLLAVPAAADMYQDGSNAKLPEARRNLGTDVFTPTDYGAKCDSNGTTGTNDSAAINQMFDAIRARDKPFTVIGPENRTCYVASSINVTGMHTFGRNLGIGSKISLRLDCATNGTPCIDAMDSRWIKWDDLYLMGLQAAPPDYGIQFGVVQAGRNADMHYFDRPVVQGYFTKAAVMNLASESTVYMLPFFQNWTTAGTTYGLIHDGYNHFNTTSAFVTQTIPVDQQQTFNDNVIISGWISANGTVGAPFWIGNAARHKFIAGYIASVAPNCVQVFQTGSQSNNFLEFDLHCETTAVQDVFGLIGTPESAVMKLNGFVFKDHNSQPSRSVFQAAASISYVLATDMQIRVGGFDNGGGTAVKLFNEPAKWQASGHITLPSPSNWVNPSVPYSFSGEVCFREPLIQCKSFSAPMSHTVATLPACNSNNTHLTLAVSDQLSAPTYRGGLTGGGAIPVLAYCNGGSWEAH